MKKTIAVFGAGRHGRVVIDTVRSDGRFEIAHLFDSNETLTSVMALPVEHSLEAMLKHIRAGIVAVGDNSIRESMVTGILNIVPDFEFVSVVHPTAYVANDVRVGVGTILMPGVRVMTGSVISNHCVINTQCSIDHDNVVEDFVNLSPGVVSGGGVRFGRSVFVGLASAFAPDVSIGAHTTIGMGSNVLTDIPERSLAYGSPCRVVRPL